MERRKALAIASAATALVGSGIVAAAAFSGASLLGFGGRASAHTSAPVVRVVKRPVAKERVVVRTRDVYDRVVVDTTSPDTAARRSEPPASASVPEPEFATTPTTVGTPQATEPTTVGTPHETEPTSSVAPAPSDDPTTSVPGTTPTARPPGVPDDWPAGTPIPPMPPNCHEPELHLNGIWECSGPGD